MRRYRLGVFRRKASVARNRFRCYLAIVSIVGLVVRCVAVARAGRTLGFTDGLFFHVQADFLADGRGFVDAGRLAYTFVAQPSAQHPPLFPLLLAIVSKFGGHSVLAHQLACAVMSSVAVPLIGLTAREVGGSRAGLVAAAIAAVYPNLWASDAAVMSESLYVTAIALVLFTSCRLWKQPSVKRAVLVGAAIGTAALVREEAILLIPFALMPQCLLQRRVPTRRQFELIGVAVLMASVVIAPWVARNLTTFDKPVFLSDNHDSVIAGANCPATYSGAAIGSWNFACNAGTLPDGDESVQGAANRARGLHYARTHLTRLPIVVAAREGRALDLFRPFQGPAETRPFRMRVAGAVAFWFTLPAAALGAVIARRRKMSLVPFGGQVAVVVFAAAAGYGLWRLRLPLDVAAITLAGVGLASFARWPYSCSRTPASRSTVRSWSARLPVIDVLPAPRRNTGKTPARRTSSSSIASAA
jgi:hypothetical protein